MEYTFLHLSDLHYRPDWPEETELVCNRFLEDVTMQMPNFKNVYLVFSGDLVLKGEESDHYTQFVEKFSTALDSIGLPRERRICVPGNHDVSRKAVKPNLIMQEPVLNSIKEEKVFNDGLPQLSTTLFDTKFDNYKSCERSFAHYNCCSTSLGGSGWELGEGVGVYCLNTALCSFGGLEDATGKLISDKGRLHIDSRSLHRWLADNKSSTRVLVLHHPLDWLTEWAKKELENIIADSFNLVLVGHKHAGMTSFSSRGYGGTVQCSAPPLFTKKSELLGYTFVSLKLESNDIDITYRQWTPSHRFVSGTSFSNNDIGKKAFEHVKNYKMLEVVDNVKRSKSTLDLLQAEFEESITCYSSKRHIWVNRDLANAPETAANQDSLVVTTLYDFVNNVNSCIIRAPKAFGLTSAGHYIALQFHSRRRDAALIMMDTADIPAHKKGVLKYIQERCEELCLEESKIAGFILDNWHNDKGSRIILNEIQTQFKPLPIVILNTVDDCSEIANYIELDGLTNFGTYYLWSLSRNSIRDLVSIYIKDHS